MHIFIRLHYVLCDLISRGKQTIQFAHSNWRSRLNQPFKAYARWRVEVIMPPMKCCKKTWSVGSDDFVISSIAGIIFHTVW